MKFWTKYSFRTKEFLNSNSRLIFSSLFGFTAIAFYRNELNLHAKNSNIFVENNNFDSDPVVKLKECSKITKRYKVFFFSNLDKNI